MSNRIARLKSLMSAQYQKRFRTKDPKTLRNFKKYPLLPPCTDSCTKKYADKLTELHRQLMNATYWERHLSPDEGFLDTHITISGINHRHGQAGIDLKRNNSLACSVPLSTGEHQVVCKTVFMHTLGMNTNGMITVCEGQS